MTDIVTTSPGVTEGSIPSDNTSETPASSLDLSKISEADIQKILDGRKEKVKINGVERELSYSELKRLASINEAANGKFENAKKMSSEAESFKKLLDSGDLVTALKKQGKNSTEIRAILEDRLIDLVKEEQLDPRERELLELKAEKAAREAEENNKKKSAEQQKQEAAVKQQVEKYENEMVDALAKTNMPKTALSFKMIAQELLGAAENDIEMTVDEAAKHVERDILQSYSELLPKLGLERIKTILGKELLAQLREESVAEVKNNTPFPKQPAGKQEQTSKPKQPEQKMGQDAYFRSLRYGNRS